MLFVVCATVLFGAALVFVKLSAMRVSPLLGNVLFSLGSLATQLTILCVALSRGFAIRTSPGWLKFSLVGGVFIGLYTVCIFYAFKTVGIMKTSPIVYPGAIAIASLASVVFLGETAGAKNILGLVMVLGGIVLIFLK